MAQSQRLLVVKSHFGNVKICHPKTSATKRFIYASKPDTITQNHPNPLTLKSLQTTAHNLKTLPSILHTRIVSKHEPLAAKDATSRL